MLVAEPARRTWVERELLAALNRSGIPVLVYSVNDFRPGGLADNLSAIGAAGLFTDDPDGMSRFTVSRRGR